MERNKPGKESVAILMVLLVVGMWSTVAVAFKLALRELQALDLVSLASFFSAFLLGFWLLLRVLMRRKGIWRIEGEAESQGKTSWLTGLALGLMNPALYYWVLFSAYSRLPAQVAQPLNYTWPVFLVLLAPVLNRYRPDLRKTLTLLPCLFGVFLIYGIPEAGLALDGTGVILALLSGLIWALYWLLGQKVKMEGEKRLFAGFIGASVVLGIFWLRRGMPIPQTWSGWAAMLWVGAFEMGITFVFWNRAITLSRKPERIASFIYLGPLLSFVWIWLILGESLRLSALGGFLVILLGLVWNRRSHGSSTPRLRGTSNLQITVVGNIEEVERAEWDSLATRPEYSPFLEYGFIYSLERSGCVSSRRGWYPCHFLARDEGRLVAAAPAYLKTHSMGEFIFDQGLAQAAASMGIQYYPKLVAGFPFTPSPGYRIMVNPDYPEREVARLILEKMYALRDLNNLGSISILFTEAGWIPPSVSEEITPKEHKMLAWTHQYFLWENQDYSSFDDFVSCFSKNQRRNILRERSSIARVGVEVRVLSGDFLDSQLMGRMYDFYRNTNANFGPWAAFFLNEQWFRDVLELWKERILIFAAFEGGNENLENAVALSMVIRKGQRMVGRYWGCSRFVKNLHFELCYYAPIEYAIREGVQYFDPGMGSQHKARRGFGSRNFESYHAFSDEKLAGLFGTLLEEANVAESEFISELDASVPWKKIWEKSGPGGPEVTGVDRYISEGEPPEYTEERDGT